MEPGPVGLLIREFRLRAGLSQPDLAERASLSLAAIAALEQGQRRYPHPRTVRQISDALDLDAAVRERLLLAARRPRRATGATKGSAPEAETEWPAAQSLPEPPTGLFGRDAEMQTAVSLLLASAPVRLLTLVGSGGVGKTRLSLAVARAVAPSFCDGVRFVDLAPVREEALVAATIARSLGLQESGAHGAHDLLIAHLRPRSMLMVLDNFEQLLGAAPLVADLLASCPGLAIVVTSRAALCIRAERLLAVEPLRTPAAGASFAAAELAMFPSVQLFLDRMKAQAPDFTFTERHADAVAALCRRLEGVPLAIELATARTGLLDPTALLGLLEQRLVRLDGGPADLPARQRTLRATLDWSHSLLGPSEQAVFRRLGVFAGGWTLDAAQTVCADASVLAGEVVVRLEELRRHSLIRVVRPQDGDAEPRFTMLETVREYAVDLLAASGELEETLVRHRDWYIALSEQVRSVWYDGKMIDRLVREQDNLRAALRRTVERGDGQAGVRLGLSCWAAWYMCGWYEEGRAWLQTLLRLPGADLDLHLYARMHGISAHLAYCAGDSVASLELAESALAMSERAGVGSSVARLQMVLGHVHRLRGDLAQAERTYLTALAHPAIDDAAHSLVLNGLARVRYEQDDISGAEAVQAEIVARALVRDRESHLSRFVALDARLHALNGNSALACAEFDECLAQLEGGRDMQGLVFAHQLAADTALDAADPARAAHHLVRIFEVTERTGEWPAVPRALEGVAELLAAHKPERALRLVGAAAALREALAVAPTPRERGRVEGWATEARATLGEGASTAALAGGRVRPLAAILQEARAACALPVSVLV